MVVQSFTNAFALATTRKEVRVTLRDDSDWCQECHPGMKNDEDNHQWWFAGDKGIYYVNVGNTTADLLRALYGVQELSDRIQFKPNKKRPKAPKIGFADSSYVPYCRSEIMAMLQNVTSSAGLDHMWDKQPQQSYWQLDESL